MDENEFTAAEQRDRLHRLSYAQALVGRKEPERQIMYSIGDVEDGVSTAFFNSLRDRTDDELREAIRRAMDAWPFSSKYEYLEEIRIRLQNRPR